MRTAKQQYDCVYNIFNNEELMEKILSLEESDCAKDAMKLQELLELYYKKMKGQKKETPEDLERGEDLIDKADTNNSESKKFIYKKINFNPNF